jgi:deoxynucleoside kinase
MKNKSSFNSKFIISIEGNIGSGKSTFLKKIAEHISCAIVYEPNKEWQSIGDGNLLDLFYKDMHRWAYSFQSYVFLTRIQSVENAIRQFPDKDIFICERSVLADRYTFARALYQRGEMTSIEWSMYCSWYNWMVSRHIQLPNLFVYLKVDSDIAHYRINKRSRFEEKNVPLEYVSLISQYHDDWLIDKKEVPDPINKIPVLVLDCNKDFESDSRQWSILVEKVVHEIKKYTSCNCC